MDLEERRKRHALNYGLYNFQDVKKHFFTKEGWRATSGPALSYDHYYIKPGKNPKNPEHKQGVDYFLGEAELVSYARKMKIFGEEVPMQPLAVNGRTHGKRRARSSSSARTSQATIDINSGDSDSDSTHRREHKRHRRRSNENNVGSSAHNPIALPSGSSDDDTSNENAEGSMDNEDSSYEEEEESNGDSTSSTSSEDDESEEYLDIVASRVRPAAPRNDKSRSEAREIKRNENGKAKAKAKGKAEAEREVKPKPKSEGVSAESDDEKGGLNHNSRPLLKTSHKKRIGVMHTSKSSKHHLDHSAKRVAGPGKHHNKKRANPKGLRTITGKKSKSAPRSLMNNTDTTHSGEEEDNDNSFDLGVTQYGESPPRRPPSRVHSRANSVMSSPAAIAGAASPPPDEQKEKVLPAPGTISSPTVSTTSRPVKPSATEAQPTTTSTPSVCAKSNTDDSSTSAEVSMELTKVALPPDRDNKYHICVSVSGSKPPVHTVWMENLSSHEQREYSFRDVLELPDAQTDIHVPTATVLTALFRCLSSQPDAVVIVGPEPRATAASKSASEKGKVQLRMSTAEKQSGEADGGGDGLTLVVTYPALDLFSVDHNFPMKLVSTDQQHQRLTQEIERLQEQLALAQTDRDKLREQLQQKEEMLHQVKAQVTAAQVRSSEEMERRVAKLVEKKIQTLTQAQEKEKRDKDRARRWVFAQSDWMSVFQPCRALIAGAAADTGTSLLRPGTAPASRKHVVEWKEVIEIAEPFFQPTATSEGGSTRSITVVKDGVYQVNANVSHDSLVEMRLVITPTNEVDATRRAAQTIAPTKVSLYDNKRRVSRVDRMLELRALDQLSLELLVLDSSTLPSGQDWLRTPMPTHNRLLIVILDEHALVAD